MFSDGIHDCLNKSPKSELRRVFWKGFFLSMIIEVVYRGRIFHLANFTEAVIYCKNVFKLWFIGQYLQSFNGMQQARVEYDLYFRHQIIFQIHKKSTECLQTVGTLDDV